MIVCWGMFAASSGPATPGIFQCSSKKCGVMSGMLNTTVRICLPFDLVSLPGDQESGDVVSMACHKGPQIRAVSPDL